MARKLVSGRFRCCFAWICLKMCLNKYPVRARIDPDLPLHWSLLFAYYVRPAPQCMKLQTTTRNLCVSTQTKGAVQHLSWPGSAHFGWLLSTKAEVLKTTVWDKTCQQIGFKSARELSFLTFGQSQASCFTPLLYFKLNLHSRGCS